MEDIARDMAGYCDDIDFDSASLAQAQERLGTLTGLVRSFGPTMDEVFARWDEASHLVSAVDDADERLAAATAALEAAEAALAEAARAYDDRRAAAAPAFSQAVGEVLAQLEMGGAELICTVEPLPRERWGRGGSADVSFAFKPGKAMQPRPLARIASGGEISRVMLAIKVVLGAKDGTETLIFDEVDAGVGGSTANALAAVLARLSESHQVIVITHLAQVAAMADHHLLITKEVENGRTYTHVQELVQEQRAEELARMISGPNVTALMLENAREMLARGETVGKRAEKTSGYKAPKQN